MTTRCSIEGKAFYIIDTICITITHCIGMNQNTKDTIFICFYIIIHDDICFIGFFFIYFLSVILNLGNVFFNRCINGFFNDRANRFNLWEYEIQMICRCIYRRYTYLFTIHIAICIGCYYFNSTTVSFIRYRTQFFILFWRSCTRKTICHIVTIILCYYCTSIFCDRNRFTSGGHRCEWQCGCHHDENSLF